jgi:hypothetical protein
VVLLTAGADHGLLLGPGLEAAIIGWSDDGQQGISWWLVHVAAAPSVIGSSSEGGAGISLPQATAATEPKAGMPARALGLPAGQQHAIMSWHIIRCAHV